MAYTRRQELTCTEAELVTYGDKILLDNEAIYVRMADGTRKTKFGDGIKKVKDIPYSLDYQAIKTQADKSTSEATKSATSAAASKTEADRAKSIADSVGYYTKGESDLKYSPSDLATAEGEILDLHTAEGTMGLEILGKTIVTPTDATQPISPDNVAVIESVGELGSLALQKSGRNLINFQNSYSEVANGVTFTFDQNTQKATLNGTVSGITNLKAFAVGRAYSIYISPGQKITYAIKMVSGSMQGSLRFYSDMGDINTNAFVTEFGVGTVTTGTAIATNQYSGTAKKIKNKNLVICLEKASNGTVFNNATFEMQVSYDDSDGIEKSISLPVSIPLKDTTGNLLEPLRSLPDGTVDRLVDIEGVWNLERNICKYIFTGNELWALDTTGSYIKDNGYKANGILPVMARSSSNLGLCSTMLFGTSSILYGGTKMGCFINGKTVCARLNALAMAQDMSDCFKAGTEIIYAISPTYTPLHPDTQTLLNNLQKSYANRTILYGTDPISPTLKATYTRPILEVIDRQIEQKKLSNAIIRKAEGDILNMPTAESNMDLEILGNTVITTRVLTFTTNSITTNGADFKFVIGDVITVAGCTTVANNKTATVVTVSADKKTLTFASSAFVASVEPNASLSTAINTDLPISPDNVAVIESVGELGSLALQKSGKNLFDLGKIPTVSTNTQTISKTVDSFTLTKINYDPSVIVDMPVNIKSGMPFTLSGDLTKNNTNGGIFIQLKFKDGTSTYPLGFMSIGKNTIKFKAPKDIVKISYYINNSGAGENVNGSCTLKNPQIEMGENFTGYEPYRVTDLITIPLKDTVGTVLEPLCSLPDGTADRLVDIEGVWQVERNARRVRGLNASDMESVIIGDMATRVTFKTSATPNMICNKDPYSYSQILCNKLQPISGSRVSDKAKLDTINTNNCGSHSTKYIFVVLQNSLTGILSTDTATQALEKAKTYWGIIGNSIEFYYTISPTYTPLHIDTQTALNNLQKSHANRTIIYGTDPVAPSFKATYTADINQVIAELQNAIIALGGTNV